MARVLLYNILNMQTPKPNNFPFTQEIWDKTCFLRENLYNGVDINVEHKDLFDEIQPYVLSPEWFKWMQTEFATMGVELTKDETDD